MKKRTKASQPSRADELTRLSRILGQIQSHGGAPSFAQLEFPWGVSVRPVP